MMTSDKLLQVRSLRIPRRDKHPSIAEDEVCGAAWDEYSDMLSEFNLTHVAPSPRQWLGLFLDEDVTKGD